MSFFIKKMPRRMIVQALVAVPALSLFRKLPKANASPSGAGPSQLDPNEIVEVNGWILKRSDLA